MGCDYPTEDRRTLLDLIEADPTTADEQTVRRLVAALRAVQNVQARWEHTGLSVSRQINDAIRDALAGMHEIPPVRPMTRETPHG